MEIKKEVNVKKLKQLLSNNTEPTKRRKKSTLSISQNSLKGEQKVIQKRIRRWNRKMLKLHEIEEEIFI